MSLTVSQAIAEAAQDGRQLLQYVLNKSPDQLLADLQELLTDEQLTHYRQLVMRRAAHEPIAYIIGHQNFDGQQVAVDSNVLIPRPETEGLVERVLAYTKTNPVKTIIEVGTGSGAIAIALAHRLPTAQIIATDISPTALTLAKNNKTILNNYENIRFIKADLLEPVGQTLELPTADIIVANLPYVPSGRIDQLKPDVKDFEPHLALDGGPDGLDLYRQLATQIKQLKTKPRAIFCEIDETHGSNFEALWPDYSVTIEQDLAGLNRYATITL